MDIERIRTQIEDGKIFEQQTGVLHRSVVNLAKVNDVGVTESDVEKVIDFVTEYIEHAPAMLTMIEDAAAVNGGLLDVQPILDTIEQYFLETNDVIPDHFGLVGLLDDAYLTHTLMGAISERYRSQSGKSLLPTGSSEVNLFIRRLIGEPFVSILDDHVSMTFDRLTGEQDINRMLVVLAQMNWSSVTVPIRGDARVTAFTGRRL